MIPRILVATLICQYLVVSGLPAGAFQSDGKTGQSAAAVAAENGPHVGPIEEALIGIRITGTGPKGDPLPPRFGNGFIVRCDGFIVAPFDLFNLTNDSTPSAPSRLSLRVTIHPGAGKEQQIVMPRRSRYFVDNMRRFGVSVFKLDGTVHTPAARTLLPDTLKAGDEVQVVWREGDPQTGVLGQLIRKTTRLAPLPDGVAGIGIVEDTAEHPGRVYLSQPIEGVPAGAVVVGPEGLVIGFMPGAKSATRDSFISTAILSRITNCVGAVPNTDADYHTKSPVAAETVETGKRGTGKMVKVPGGPVLVPRDLLFDQPDMEGAPIACVAPFEIDRLEVTNEEYLAFWNSLSEAQRSDPLIRKQVLPLAWSPVGEPFSSDLAKLPVLGVPLRGAYAYAASQGKRLPTPYEWAKAAFGPKGETVLPEWFQLYRADRVRAWNAFGAAHADYLRGSIGLMEFARNPVDANGRAGQPFIAQLHMIPWLGLPPAYGREVRFSFEATARIVEQLNEAWRWPTSVIAVGKRPYDVSPYGAEDLILNAYELYVPNPGTPVFGEPRYTITGWLPTAPPRFANGYGFDPMVTPWIQIAETPLTMSRLSRLYKRTLFSNPAQHMTPAISFEDILFASNLAEVTSAIRPFASWWITRGSKYEWNESFQPVPAEYMPTVNDGSELTRSTALKASPWISRAINYSAEIGYPPAAKGTILVPPDRNFRPLANERSQLSYIMPVGFRCVR